MYKKGINFKIIGILIILLILFAAFAPKQIAKYSAIAYVEENYPEYELVFMRVEMDKRVREGHYVVIFSMNGEEYRFFMNRGLIPNKIFWDPFIQAG